MFRKSLLLLMALALIAILIAPAMAQDDEKPTVAILRFGPHLSFRLVDQGLLTGMAAAGLISVEEQTVALLGSDVAGERVDVVRLDANFDFTNAALIVEQAIDAGADVLITYSTPVTQTAIHITADLDDPPIVIFASVYNPIEAGIAKATCIKPDHVTGVELATPYEEIVPLLLEQDPGIKTIGLLYSASESSGQEGARHIVEIANSLGLEVAESAVTQASELSLATEGLVESGAEALIIPADMITVSALPIIMQVATENGLPVFHSNSFAFNDGATVSAGASGGTIQGSLIAGMLSGYLDGSLDIGRTGIAVISNMNVNLNLDSAEAQGIEISDALKAMASVVIEDGEQRNETMRRAFSEMGLDNETVDLVMAAANRRIGTTGEEIPVPPHVQEIISRAMGSGRRGADTGAMLESLHCTDEMIAEQQAALDASD